MFNFLSNKTTWLLVNLLQNMTEEEFKLKQICIEVDEKHCERVKEALDEIFHIQLHKEHLGDLFLTNVMIQTQRKNNFYYIDLNDDLLQFAKLLKLANSRKRKKKIIKKHKQTKRFDFFDFFGR